MLKGCVPWPAEVARRYIEAGLWEGVTVAEMVERTARRLPQKVALVHGEDRITYQELIRSAKRLASGLLRLGLKPQDRAVVQLPNRPEFVSLYLALNYIGVIPVMALRAHRQAEIRHFVRSSGAAAYFIADWVGTFDYRPMATEIAAEFPSLRHVVVVGEAGAGPDGVRRRSRRARTSTKHSSAACGRMRRMSRPCSCRAGRRLYRS